MNPLCVLCVAPSDNGSLMAVGTSFGFIVFDVQTGGLRKLYHRTFRKGIGFISVAARSNVVALVGGGIIPYEETNTVVVWDDRTEREVFRSVTASEVKGIRLTPNYLFVVHELDITMIPITAKTETVVYKTAPNPLGLMLYHETSGSVFFPATTTGDVQIIHRSAAKSKTIHAHKHTISCLAINTLGTVLATASQEGLIVRIWDVSSAMKIKELTRGNTTVNVLGLSIDPNQSFVLSFSSDDCINIFDIEGKTKLKSKLFSQAEATDISFKLAYSGVRAFFTSKSRFIVIGKSGIYQRFILKYLPDLCKYKVEQEGRDQSVFEFFDFPGEGNTS